MSKSLNLLDDLLKALEEDPLLESDNHWDPDAPTPDSPSGHAQHARSNHVQPHEDEQHQLSSNHPPLSPLESGTAKEVQCGLNNELLQRRATPSESLSIPASSNRAEDEDAEVRTVTVVKKQAAPGYSESAEFVGLGALNSAVENGWRVAHIDLSTPPPSDEAVHFLVTIQRYKPLRSLFSFGG